MAHVHDDCKRDAGESQGRKLSTVCTGWVKDIFRDMQMFQMIRSVILPLLIQLRRHNHEAARLCPFNPLDLCAVYVLTPARHRVFAKS